MRHATNSELLCEARFCMPLPDNRCLTMKTCVKSAAMRSRKRRKRLCVNWESTRIRGNTETIKRAE
ncbi:hypothetical protein RKK42_01945 [Klebsiella pneumoniae]|nr:hypothetical protein [Klebsiella pneumoniae]